MLRRGLVAMGLVAGAIAAVAAPANIGLVGGKTGDFETRAAHAILLDAATDTVLFQKAPDERMPPASMAKLMTTAVVFDAVKAGKLKLTDEFVVSETAWRQGGIKSGGSTMFAKLNSSISVDDLMHGVIIQSGNDACITVAEGMAGTEASFAGLMNEEARHIGLTGSHFANSTGLPDPDQYMTAHDLARLAKYIIEQFPESYKIYGEREFTWNKIKQPNRNPLLDMNIGADGLKTGFTDEAGYGLVGSAVRDGQRLIVVVNGLKSAKERGDEAKRPLEYGFKSFEARPLFEEGTIVGAAKLFGGASGRVDLVGNGAINVLMPKNSSDRLSAKIVYAGPVPAPIAAGQQVASLNVYRGDRLVLEAPLYAVDSVERGNLRQRAFDGAAELVIGLIRMGVGSIGTKKNG